MTVPAAAVREPPAPPAGDWRRLDRRMLLVHPVLELGRALPALVGLLIAGAGSGHGSRWSLIGTGLVLAAAIARWFTTRYRITATQIELRHGLLRRRTVTVRLDRVRTVDVTAHLLHRMLGLTRVVVGTGLSDRKDRGRSGLTLDGLGSRAADSLRDELLHRSPAPAAATAGPSSSTDVELARLSARWIGYAPFTLSGAVTAVAIGGFAWRLVSEAHLDPERVGPLRDLAHYLRERPLWLDTVEIGVAVLAFIALASTVGYVLAFWGFRLTRQAGGTLHVTRGLLTSRATTIEERRLRGAELSEPLLLRAVGGARTLAITTGLRVGRGAERGGTMLLPPAPQPRAEQVAVQAIGAASPFTAPLTRHGPRATRRRYSRAVGVSVAVVAASGAAWTLAGRSGWGWLASLVLVAASIPLAADRARSLGHALVDGYLVTRFGSLVRRRSAVECDSIIGWNLRRSFFQRRAGLATLTATTAAGRQRYRLRDVTLPDAVALAQAATPGLLEQFHPGVAEPVSRRR